MTTLLSLFDGRHDCYFDSLLKKEGHLHPGALIWCTDGQDMCAEDMWSWAFAEHEHGARDIGVYPRTDDGLCKWGCVDIDTGDLSEALEVWSVLKDAGVGAWIEASGSWKDLTKRGYHVWVFSDEWIEAINMRALLVEVVRQAGLPDKTEINPKQIEATKKGVGNCVRLPYGKRSREHPGYSCMTFSPAGEFKDWTAEEFLDEVMMVDHRLLLQLGDSAIRRAGMRKAARAACEALRQHEQFMPPFAPGGATKTGGTNQRAWKILHGLDRAGDGERNLCAFVIACHLKGAGKSLDQAISELTVCCERSFDDGANFVGEAVEVCKKVWRGS